MIPLFQILTAFNIMLLIFFFSVVLYYFIRRQKSYSDPLLEEETIQPNRFSFILFMIIAIGFLINWLIVLYFGYSLGWENFEMLLIPLGIFVLALFIIGIIIYKQTWDLIYNEYDNYLETNNRDKTTLIYFDDIESWYINRSTLSVKDHNGNKAHIYVHWFHPIKLIDALIKHEENNKFNRSQIMNKMRLKNLNYLRKVAVRGINRKNRN